MRMAICVIFAFSLLFCSMAHAAEDWTQKYPDPHPTARGYHKMAYAGEDKVLLFGGFDTSTDDETWIYDVSANSWTQITPASHPGARMRAPMAYIGSDQVLLFGGNDAGGMDDETWIYDVSDSNWTQINPLAKPDETERHAMAFIGDDRVLLFGGYEMGGISSETWVYDLSESTWTQKYPNPHPSGRVDHAMAYIGDDKVLLYGGDILPGWATGTWVYDLSDNAWTQMSPTSSPRLHILHDMAYMGGDRVLLACGQDMYFYSDTSWVYDLGDDNWTFDPNVTHPQQRTNYGLSETSLDGSSFIVLFGGQEPDADFNGETWTFGGGDYPMGVPEVNVTYPNGGEVLTDSAEVLWAATVPDTGETALLLIDLEYSADAGESWTAVDSNQVNDGTYFWDLSGFADADSCLMRITALDTSGQTGFDESDAVFAIENYNLDPVALLFPNGGETLSDSAIITWTVSDPDPGDSALLMVDLYYSSDAGDNWNTIQDGLPNTGSYLWNLFGLYSNDEYLVWIMVTDTTDFLFTSDVSDTFFAIAHPDPHIDSIEDVPDDQGKQVLILWDRSYLDAPEHQVITYYSIWRRHVNGSKLASTGLNWTGQPPEDLSRPVYRIVEREDGSGGLKSEYWEFIGSVDAHFFEGYAYIAATLEDSCAAGIPYATFLVSAQTADPFVFYDSAPDSGYSVDDVDPAKTQIGIMASGSAKGSVNTIWLAWTQVTAGVDGSPEQGAIDYRIYCDESFDFAPGPGNLVATTSELSYPHTDSRIGDPAANLYYMVTATDGSGNESAVSNVVGEFDRDLRETK